MVHREILSRKTKQQQKSKTNSSDFIGHGKMEVLQTEALSTMSLGLCVFPVLCLHPSHVSKVVCFAGIAAWMKHILCRICKTLTSWLPSWTVVQSLLTTANMTFPCLPQLTSACLQLTRVYFHLSRKQDLLRKERRQSLHGLQLSQLKARPKSGQACLVNASMPPSSGLLTKQLDSTTDKSLQFKSLWLRWGIDNKE